MVIVGELCKYDEVFYEKLCWFVFNKLDMVLEDECEVCVVDFFDCFGWDGFVFEILVLMGQGCEVLCYVIYDYFFEYLDVYCVVEVEDFVVDVCFCDVLLVKGGVMLGDDV